MKQIISCSLHFFVIYLTIVILCTDAKYALDAPEHWSDEYPDCRGDKQSPINIITSEAKDEGIIYIAYENIGLDAINMTLSNVGYAVEITGTFPIQPSVRFGNDYYKFLDFSLVWGTNSQDGSFHAIDGTRYAGETLTRFYNKEQEKPYLAISYLLEVDDTVEDKGPFTMLSTYFNKIKSVGSSMEIPKDRTFPLDAFSEGIENFFLYDGSLAWPPCTENVLRIVKKEPIPVPSKVMEALREVELQDDAETNGRPIQFISQQNVRLYKKE